MADLCDLQRALLARIAWPDGTDPADLVRGDHMASASERLDVYARMYLARLTDALAAGYPAVAAVLGDEFAAEAKRFLALHPSRNPSLRWLGRYLPDFLEGPFFDGAPWLGALARLERARLAVFDAPDAPPLRLERLRTLPAEQLVDLWLQLVPASRRIQVAYAVDDVWPKVTRGEAVSAPDADPRLLLVWREGVQVHHRRIDALEAELLELVAIGVPAGVVFEGIAERVPHERVAETAFAILGRWASDEIVRAT
jgi:hypothetical protein